LRHFTPWMKYKETEEHSLPGMIRKVTGQVSYSPWLNASLVELTCRPLFPLEMQ
jgi:hypothetical protein